MKLFLKLLFGSIFIWMVTMTFRTCFAMSLWNARPGFGANPWTVATLRNAFFGFLTFYVWVVYKQRRIIPCLLWFLLIMTLGNIATSLYVLVQRMRLRSNDPIESILWSRKA